MTDAADELIPGGLDATLVLVRHGESTYIVEGRFQGQAETPLSPTGTQQADLVASRLATPHAPASMPVPVGPPLEIAHSPLLRTTQTAAAIQRAMGSARLAGPLRPDYGFAEIHQGAWQGLLHSEVSERYGAELSAWRRTPLEAHAPGGEALPDVQVRVRASLARILRRLADGRPAGTPDGPQVPGYDDAAATHPWSIVVGHDGIFKVALLTLFGLTLDRFWMWSMDLCGITIVEFRAGRPVLRAHNLTGHLVLAERDPAEAQAAEERARSGAL